MSAQVWLCENRDDDLCGNQPCDDTSGDQEIRNCSTDDASYGVDLHLDQNHFGSLKSICGDDACDEVETQRQREMSGGGVGVVILS